MYEQLAFNLTEPAAPDALTAFVDRAAQDANVLAAARNWCNRRGGDLHPVDIRQLRDAIREVEGYSDLEWWQVADFMDIVAYGVVERNS